MVGFCLVPFGDLGEILQWRVSAKENHPHVTKMNPPKTGVIALIDCSSVLNNEGYLY